MKNAQLEALSLRARTSGQRAKTESMVIAALPDDEDLDIRRVTCEPSHLRLRANADARIDLQVQSYSGIAGLMNRFAALPLSRVKMFRSGQTPTLSFYPTARVPAEWDKNYETGPIAPALFQVAPGPGSTSASVYVEWFTQLAGLVVNIRAYVTEHDCGIVRKGSGAWVYTGRMPSGKVRQTGAPTDGGPPMVTVYWPTDAEFLEAMEDTL